MGQLATEIKYLPGVGPKRAQLLETELSVKTFEDLIRTYPFRYIDRSGIWRIADVKPDLAFVQVIGRVVKSTLLGPGGSVFDPSKLNGRFGAVKRLSVIVADDSGEMEMVFFKAIKWNYERLQPGSCFVFFGKPVLFNGAINIVHPEVDAPPQSGQASLSGTLTGVYNSTEKLKNAGITGRMMNKMVSSALSACLPEVEETLPQYILEECGLCPLRYALQNIHFPQSQTALEKATNRLKFEELFFLQLSLLKQKYVRCRSEQGIRMPKIGPDFNSCFAALPYELTGAQKRVIKEIREDLRSGRQMNRLLQGDVGSGKTMVAILSALIAVGNGYQACIMAPTEVLAQQHYANIVKYLASTSCRVTLLTGSTPTKERRAIHEGLEDGSIGIIIGTHALIEDDVRFHSLGLAIIDEQHRFGVDQRSKLWNKSTAGAPPHVLVMTATPIPRTLAMTLYGDLDVSVIDEMPPGRKPIRTMQISQAKRLALYTFIRREIAKGRQVFIVYPLIFESEKLDLQNLQRGYEEIVAAFPDCKVAIVHGKQTNEDKAYNMAAFAKGVAHILVSTTVIEVGVDVPNASVMVIESAQRFGLSQLHQLRGRVGRGAEESFCILVRDEKLSNESRKRIELLCSTQDGFVLAEEDMKMRGPGDLEGTQQSGLPVSLGIASLARDGLVLSHARDVAEKVLSADPTLENPLNASLLKELQKGKYDMKDYSQIS